MEQQMNFGVIGGGISGLSTAYFLRKAFPSSKITLFEKSEKLGGWLKTGTNKHQRTTEQGARVIKNDLSAQNFFEICSFSGISAKDFVSSEPSCSQLLVPNWQKKNQLEVLTSQPAKEMYQQLNLIYFLNNEQFEKDGVFKKDMSIRDFLTHFKSYTETCIWEFENQCITTILKMVFAGNTDQLSATMMLGRYLNFIKQPPVINLKIKYCKELMEQEKTEIEGNFVALNKGFSHLVEALQQKLVEGGNFQIIQNGSIKQLKVINQQEKFCIDFENTNGELKQFEFDYVISTVGAKSLHKIVKEVQGCSQLQEISKICSQIKYGSLATVNIVLDDLEVPMIDTDKLHILIPDSYYHQRKGTDHCINPNVQVQQFHLMSNLFPLQTGNQFKIIDHNKLHLTATVSIPEGFTDDKEIVVEVMAVFVDLILNQGPPENVKEMHPKVVPCILEDALPIFEAGHQERVYDIVIMNESWESKFKVTGNWLGQQSSITGSIEMAKKVVDLIYGQVHKIVDDDEDQWVSDDS